ncbi:N/A [soil metagenome]
MTELGASPGPLRFLTHVAGGLPWSDLPVFGRALGAFVGDVLRVRRAHVEAAMTRAGVAEPALEAAQMYRDLGTSFAELLWLGGAARDLSAHVEIDAATRRTWRDHDALGRGLVVAASHTGNWDLAAASTAQLLGPLTVVTKRLSLGAVDALWQWTRRRYGVTLIPPTGALARARTVLAGGGAVAMMIDQVPASRAHASPCTFLGQEAWVDRAPAILALRMGAPLLVTASERLADGRQRLSILSAEVPLRDAGPDWARAATERATAALDRFVRARPRAWLWMHRRWKDPLPTPRAVR